MRDSFIFYNDWWSVIKEFPPEQRLNYMNCITDYFINGVIPKKNTPEYLLIQFVKQKKQHEGKPKGQHHWNWKGGVSNENHVIRTSKEMNNWRKSVFIRDSYTCQICGNIGGILNAHHKKPFSIYPKLRFEVSNGITLCRDCHIELHKHEREWQQ